MSNGEARTPHEGRPPLPVISCSSSAYLKNTDNRITWTSTSSPWNRNFWSIFTSPKLVQWSNTPQAQHWVYTPLLLGSLFLARRPRLETTEIIPPLFVFRPKFVTNMPVCICTNPPAIDLLFFFFFRMLAQSYTPNIHTPSLFHLILCNPFTTVLHKRLTVPSCAHTCLLNRNKAKQRLSPRYAAANREPGLIGPIPRVNLE